LNPLARAPVDWQLEFRVGEALLPAHAAGRHRSLHRILRTVREEP
jgi:hypothetical protein